MRRTMWAFALAVVVLCPGLARAGGASEAAGSEPLPVGAAFPDVSLGSDLPVAHRDYLGIAKKRRPGAAVPCDRAGGHPGDI